MTVAPLVRLHPSLYSPFLKGSGKDAQRSLKNPRRYPGRRCLEQDLPASRLVSARPTSAPTGWTPSSSRGSTRPWRATGRDQDLMGSN